MNNLRVFFLALLLLASPLLQVARCDGDAEAEAAAETVSEDATDLGIVGSEADAPEFGDENFNPAPGIETVCVFPKNSAKTIPAGQESELLVGLKNDGLFDHRLLVQNLTAQTFNNATVPTSAQATFPYIFAVSKFLQAGTFDLVGTIIYEIDQQPYQSTFYNGTVEVVEVGNLLSMESVLLITLGSALVVLFGIWIHGQIQNLSKVQTFHRVIQPFASLVSSLVLIIQFTTLTRLACSLQLRSGIH
ncbi:Translocon-associated protein subunit alpha [Linum perenne]